MLKKEAWVQWIMNLYPSECMETFKLREWQYEDLTSLVVYADNPDIARYMTDGFPSPYTEKDGRTYLDMVVGKHPVNIFAIDINGKAVGSIGVFLQSDVHRKNAELGYWLAEKYWGQGIMPEAIRQIVEYAFSTFDINRIFARPYGNNPKSHRVLEKAGFLLEARFEKTIYKKDEYLDEYIYAKRK